MIGVIVRSTLLLKPATSERGKATKRAESIPIERLRKLLRILAANSGIKKHSYNVPMTAVNAGTFSDGRTPVRAPSSQAPKKHTNGTIHKTDPNPLRNFRGFVPSLFIASELPEFKC
jgi:hypothetical protein